MKWNVGESRIHLSHNSKRKLCHYLSEVNVSKLFRLNGCKESSVSVVFNFQRPS